MGEYRNTFESMTDLARGDAKLYERASANLDIFDTNIRKKRIYNSDNKYKMTIGRNSWYKFADDIMKDETMRNEWVSDIAGMSLAFKNDVDFAERVYIGGLEKSGIDYSEEDIKEFRKKISSSERYRFDIATAITAQRGFRPGRVTTTLGVIPWNAAEYYDPSTDEKIYERYEYNRYNGDIPAVLGEGITFKNDKYVTDESWNSMNTQAKQTAFDLKFKQIAVSPDISGREKLIMFEQLFNNVPNPYDATYEEYVENIAPRVVQEIIGYKSRRFQG